jgi:hypothetical protein
MVSVCLWNERVQFMKETMNLLQQGEDYLDYSTSLDGSMHEA